LKKEHQHIGKTLLWPIILNISITIAQFIGGLISGSLSIMTDALHNFSDVISLLISYFANRLVRQKNTLTRTFGLQRSEIIAAAINGVTLLIISVFIIVEAIERLITPRIVEPELIIILGIAGIMVNGFSVILIHKDSDNNLNIKSAYLHLFTDMLTSIAVVIGGISIYYWEVYWIDSVLSIGIAIYLTIISIQLFKESISILMMFVPKGISVKEVSKRLVALDGIKNIHHIHLWQLNDYEIHIEAHVDFNENITIDDFVKKHDEITQILEREFKITHCTIQPEYNIDGVKAIIEQDF